MNKLLKNIHWLFWGLALFSLIYGVYVHLKMADAALDFNIYDTMFVISTVVVIGFQTFVFFMFGLAYYLFYNKDKYKPINFLSIIHVLLTVIGLVVLFFMSDSLNKLPLDSTRDFRETMRENRIKQNIKIFSGLSVFLTQPLFLINLFVAIFRK